MKKFARIPGVVFAGLAAVVAACGQPSQSANAAQAEPSNETFQDFGNYEVHYNAVRTDALTPEVARSYSIQRSTNRVMLNVTVLRKDADRGPRKPVDATVQVSAYNLNGQLKPVEVRRISEGEAIYYIGEVSITGTEILVFDISVTPKGEKNPFKVKLKREFFST
jgi:hypothetical protein